MKRVKNADFEIDYVLVIGGGGLAAGCVKHLSQTKPNVKIIGVERKELSSMKTSIANDYNTELTEIDKFVDGAAVKRVRGQNFLEFVNKIE